jgi:hypothetical protein
VAPANAFAEPGALASDAPPPSAQPGGYLVWSADSASAQTVWIDGAGRVAAARPQVVIGAGDALWAFSKGKGATKGIDCECMQKHDFDEKANCPASGQAETADIVDLVSGRRVSLVPAPPPAEGQAPAEQWIQPLASAGPYLFAEVRSYGDACGAHGFEGLEKPVFDLGDGGRPVDLVAAGDTAAVLAREGTKARTDLEQGGQAWTPLQDFRLTAIEARWTGDGRLDVGYRFAAGACYACTDEDASAYSASTLVPAASPPAKLAALVDAPEVVRRWWQANPPRAHAGWSAAPAGSLERFRAP